MTYRLTVLWLSCCADSVAEAAVVGIHDELSGQAVNAFVSLKEGNETNDQVKKDLVLQVRKSIGPFAAPKAIFVVEDLPKTRSGKIMRRILRKILSGEEDSLGDTSTVNMHLFRFYCDDEKCGSADLGYSCPTPALWIKLLRLSVYLESDVCRWARGRMDVTGNTCLRVDCHTVKTLRDGTAARSHVSLGGSGEDSPALLLCKKFRKYFIAALLGCLGLMEKRKSLARE